jgi:hypothetical protein
MLPAWDYRFAIVIPSRGKVAIPHSEAALTNRFSRQAWTLFLQGHARLQ